jgi:hypothetical protein
LVVYTWTIIDGASTTSPRYVTLRNLPKQIIKQYSSYEAGSKLYIIYITDLPVMLGNSLASEGHGGCCGNFT